MENEITTPKATTEEEEKLDFSLRPKVLGDFVGQVKLKEKLKIFF